MKIDEQVFSKLNLHHMYKEILKTVNSSEFFFKLLAKSSEPFNFEPYLQHLLLSIYSLPT